MELNYSSIVANKFDLMDSNYAQVKSEQQKENMEEVERIGFLKAIQIVLSKYENISLIYSISKCFLKANLMRLEGTIYGDEDMVHKSQIKIAKGVHHRCCQIGQSFSEMVYGTNNVLVPSRNIASKKVLRNEEDKQAYIELRNTLSKKIKEKDLISFIGFPTSCLDKNFIDNIEIFEPKSVNTEGVCVSSCMYLLSKIIGEKEIDEDSLIHHAMELREGVPAKVAATQNLIEDFDIKKDEYIKTGKSSDEVVNIFCDNIVSTIHEIMLSRGNKISNTQLNEIRRIVFKLVKELNESESFCRIVSDLWKNNVLSGFSKEFDLFDHWVKDIYYDIDPDLKSLIVESLRSHFAQEIDGNYSSRIAISLYGLKVDMQETMKIRDFLGYDSASSKEYLQKFKYLSHGIYELGFVTGNSAHTVLYIKTEQAQGYLFDPNDGLIKCDTEDHKITFLKMLSFYPPPSIRLPHENDDRNYYIEITKFKKHLSNSNESDSI